MGDCCSRTLTLKSPMTIVCDFAAVDPEMLSTVSVSFCHSMTGVDGDLYAAIMFSVIS